MSPTPITSRAANTGAARVALVHDWLTGMRGGERVLEALCELLPAAKIFTLLHNQGSVSSRIETFEPNTSFIQHLPLSRTHYRHYLPLFPTAIEQFNLDEFDLIVSTSHCVAKAAIPVGRAKHLCYCFTPMRYAWDQLDAYFGPKRVGTLKYRLYRSIMRRIARWDVQTAGRVDEFVAISDHVAKRIDQYYERPSQVIYPPVDTDFFTPSNSAPDDYFLIVSALVPYKRVDLAIAAAEQAHVPLRIIGRGPESTRLRAQGGPNVTFVEHCSDFELRDFYRNCRAFLQTGEEDFGIAPVEAQACGRPVIALARGGACETVETGVTGYLVDEDSPRAFADAINRLDNDPFDQTILHRSASRFSRTRFMNEIRSKIESVIVETP